MRRHERHYQYLPCSCLSFYYATLFRAIVTLIANPLIINAHALPSIPLMPSRYHGVHAHIAHHLMLINAFSSSRQYAH